MAIKTAIYGKLDTTTGRPAIERFVTTYEGCVLALRERNGYNDSDFDAVVWDAESQSIKSIEYASTRGYTYDNGATIDATPETYAAVLEALVCGHQGASASAAWKKAITVEVGKMVMVTRGRKVKPGTEGRVFWMRDGRAGIETADGDRTFVDADYLTVADPQDWFTCDLSQAAEADRKLAESRFRSTYGSAALTAAKGAAGLEVLA